MIMKTIRIKRIIDKIRPRINEAVKKNTTIRASYSRKI